MREEQSQQLTGTHKQNPMSTFKIRVENKFDEDRMRTVRVSHKDSATNTRKEDILHYIEEDPTQQAPQTSTPLKLKKKDYELLSPGDSLVIQVGNETGEFKKDVYIELPYVADYKFFCEAEEGEKKETEIPILNIARDTSKESKTGDAKTIIKIPRYYRAWQLEVSSPKNWKEHYQTKNLLDDFYQNEGGTTDNVSVGDNGP